MFDRIAEATEKLKSVKFTRSGNRVLNLTIKTNGGNPTTFPIKGSSVRYNKDYTTYLDYQIWTLDLKADVLSDHPDDLMLPGETP